MKRLLLFPLLLIPFFPYAQQAGNRENAGFWVAKGVGQMAAGQHAEAYTAFQLARSLGAPDMAAKMELAKKRNINSIQFRALVAEARAQATTDPTQSLRLLEYAHQKFPDSTSLLPIIGEVANQPHNWYYTLRADSIRASPNCTYLLAYSDKSRLYHRRGDSLTLIHTFQDRPRLHVFSPDERYLFVATRDDWRGSLLALHGPKTDLPRSFGAGVRSVRFSPNPAYGAWMLVNRYNRGAYLHDLQSADPTVGLVKLPDKLMHECLFSSGGRYLISPTGLLALSPHQVLVIKPFSSRSWTQYGNFTGYFPADDRHLLLVDSSRVVGAPENGFLALTMTLYTMPTPGDTVQRPIQGLGAEARMPRRLWTPFSADGHYLFARVSYQAGGNILYTDGSGWHTVERKWNAARKPADTLARTYLSMARFSPTNHLLTLEEGTDERAVARLWQLAGKQQRLIHEFEGKTAVADDVFSPDGRYLLAHHTNADCLWRIEPDTVMLVHRFARPLRQPKVFDEGGWPVASAWFSPKSSYLITYSSATQEADSLWRIGPHGLLPVYGFSTRLKAGSTVFSPDERLLITEGSGPQPAMAWPVAGQIPLLSDQLTSATEALFSPQGHMLLTQKPIGADPAAVASTIWRTTDRGLLPVATSTVFGEAGYFAFSPDGQYLMESSGGNQGETALFRVQSDRIDVVHRYQPKQLVLHMSEGCIDIPTFQTGLFSPDGRRWVQAQTVGGHDTLWTLAGTALTGRPQNAIDRYIIDTNGGSIFRRWHPRPAALFSPDSRFLMARECEALRCYELTPKGQSYTLGAKSGWPIDVSANGQYWLTLEAPVPKSVFKSLEGDSSDFIPPLSMDTLRLWRRTETPQGHSVWNRLNWLSPRYDGRNTALNTAWQGSRQQSLFSPAGNYLLLTTVPSYDMEGMTTLFRADGNTLRPVVNLNTRAYTAAHIVSSPANGWEAGLIYSDNQQQTYLLRYGSAGTRTTSLGFGTLTLPPRFSGNLAWWVRKKDDSQQTVELLDLATTKTLVQVPFGAVLDIAVRPNGNVWVVSTAGARLVRSPGEVLRWLKQAPVASLAAGLRSVYGFL